MKLRRWAVEGARRSNVVIPILGLIAAVAGCSSIRPSILPQEHPGVAWDHQQLSEALTQRLQQFQSLKVFASVSYKGVDGSGGFKEAILVQRPHRLRLETISPFGAVLIVTADGEDMAGYDPRGGIFFTGRSSKKNLLRLIQIPLELGEVTTLLLGLPPVKVGEAWKWDGNTAFRGLWHGGEDRIEFDRRIGTAVKWERYGRDGLLEIRTSFSDFFPASAGLFPLNISIEAPEASRQLEIRYQEPEVNISLPSTLFVQKKPASAREILLESLGG